MRNVLFAHGKPPIERYKNPELPKPHEANWFPWAKAQLESKGLIVDIPALPKPYYPVYTDWKNVFDSFSIDQHTGLVGFSAGANFVLRLLSSNINLCPERVVLVAPWQDKADKYGDFSKFTLDPELGERVGKLIIISATDDSQPNQEYADEVATTVPTAEHVKLSGFGHFMIGSNMPDEKFPELIHALLDDPRG